MTTPYDTLADLVVNNASRARILDRLGLDYCCGGTETLGHACTRLGLDTTDVVAALDTTATADENHNCDQMNPAAFWTMDAGIALGGAVLLVMVRGPLARALEAKPGPS